MNVAIISDIHDNIPNLDKALKWCQENSIIIICCGDVTTSDTLQYMASHYSGTVYLVRGNMEIYDDIDVEMYNNFEYLGKFKVIEIENKKIGICHEPAYIDDLLEKSSCDYIFYGHTHKPWEEKRGGTKVINPGTVAGTFSKPTFAVWDTVAGNIELKMIELM